MKKKALWIVLTLILFFGILFVLEFQSYLPVLPSRMAKYHTKGSIIATLDGEQMDLTGLEISHRGEINRVDETAVVDRGCFAFREGHYGPNHFTVYLPHSKLGEIEVNFGLFNTNWWHVNEYHIWIDMTNNPDGTVAAVMRCTRIEEGTQKNPILVEKVLTEEEPYINQWGIKLFDT